MTFLNVFSSSISCWKIRRGNLFLRFSLLEAPDLDGLDDKVLLGGEGLVVERVAALGPPVVEVAVEAEAEVAVAGPDVQAVVAAADKV